MRIKLTTPMIFSDIYRYQKKEIIGSDTKSYLNSKDFKIKRKNKPRIFSNTVAISKEYSSFEKSVFTLCDYRENDKCPPGLYNPQKCYMTIKKRQYITTMH